MWNVDDSDSEVLQIILKQMFASVLFSSERFLCCGIVGFVNMHLPRRQIMKTNRV